MTGYPFVRFSRRTKPRVLFQLIQLRSTNTRGYGNPRLGQDNCNRGQWVVTREFVLLCTNPFLFLPLLKSMYFAFPGIRTMHGYHIPIQGRQVYQVCLVLLGNPGASIFNYVEQPLLRFTASIIVCAEEDNNCCATMAKKRETIVDQELIPHKHSQ